MPANEIERANWQKILAGHELGQSNVLCSNHFNTNDLKKVGNRYHLIKGASPDPMRLKSDSLQARNVEEYAMDVDTESTAQPASNKCENCELLQVEVQNLKHQIVILKSEHNFKVLALEQSIRIEKEKSRKHVQGKKSLKNTLIYHRTNEAKMKSIIDTLKQENLVSEEAAIDLKVNY